MSASSKKFQTEIEKELDHSLARLFEACELFKQKPSIENYQNIISVLEELHTKHPEYKREQVTNDLAAAYLYFGRYLEREGRLDEALKSYEKAIKLRPGEVYTEECRNSCKGKLEKLGLVAFTDERPEHIRIKPEAIKPEAAWREPKSPEGEVHSFGLASSIWDRPGQPTRSKTDPWKSISLKRVRKK